MSADTPLWLLVAAYAIAGAVLVHRGMRRKLRDDHPHCKACGYDLFGQPSPVLVCSECGASLTAPESIEIGYTNPNRRVFRSGLWSLGYALLFALIFGYSGIQFANLPRYAPTHWVLEWAGSPRSMHQLQAFTELQKRITARQLTDAEWAELAKLALVHRFQHTDMLGENEWPLLIRSGRAQNRIPDDLWTIYVQKLVELQHSASQSERNDARLELWQLDADARAATSSPL